MHEASARGRTEVARELLNAKADVTAMDVSQRRVGGWGWGREGASLQRGVRHTEVGEGGGTPSAPDCCSAACGGLRCWCAAERALGLL